MNDCDKKVFCWDCIWYEPIFDVEVHCILDERCRHPKLIKYSPGPIICQKIKPSPNKINKNNDCKYHTKERFLGLFNFIHRFIEKKKINGGQK